MIFVGSNKWTNGESLSTGIFQMSLHLFWKRKGGITFQPCQNHLYRHLMPSFMKGLQSRPCHCGPSQVSSGRPSIGKKHVWLIFLTWSYTTWVFPHLHFLLHRVNALTLAKRGHSENEWIHNVRNSQWQLWRDPRAWLFWATTKGFRLEYNKAKCGK